MAQRLEDGIVAFEARTYDEACGILHPFALRGAAAAQHALGDPCFRGRNAEQDFKKAHRWLTFAAEQGEPFAAEPPACD